MDDSCYRPVTPGSGIPGSSELAQVTGTASPNHAGQRVQLRGTVTSEVERRWRRAGHVDVRVAPLLGSAGAAWPGSTAAAFRVRKHRGRAVQTV
jgi:hypothetical protein